MRRKTVGLWGVAGLTAVALLSARTALCGPMPLNAGPTTVSYTTNSGGVISFSEPRDFTGFPFRPLPGAPNIATFSDVNGFGRRSAGTLRPGESIISHAFFKFPDAHDADFFPDIVTGGTVTVTVSNIQFDRPVAVDETTVLFHTLFDSNQVNCPGGNCAAGVGLDFPYEELNNHFTLANPLRDAAALAPFGVTSLNTVFGDSRLSFMVTQNAPDIITIDASVPYELFRSIEETGMNTPDPTLVPAPQGFLEPFHFHIEYVVTPEPTTLMLLLAGAMVVVRRRRRAA